MLEPPRAPGAVTVTVTNALAGFPENTRNARVLPRQGERACPIKGNGTGYRGPSKICRPSFTRAANTLARRQSGYLERHCYLRYEEDTTFCSARCVHIRLTPSSAPPSLSREDSSTHSGRSRDMERKASSWPRPDAHQARQVGGLLGDSPLLTMESDPRGGQRAAATQLFFLPTGSVPGPARACKVKNKTLDL